MKTEKPPKETMPKSEIEWKSKLSQDQYRVLREKGTEMAFTGKYWDNHDDGFYHCAGCNAALFSSKTKFDSGTGWPSFSDAQKSDAVELKKDTSHGMVRTEVLCKKCGGHLGHLFDDGPSPTGQRYCINSCCLDFKGK
jgi:peptide-methionine (R)-S-oxide reductase